ncbi:hypothetical protein ACFQFS_15180 [Novosphingobium lubricantis]|jgi:hypothetical protein
MLPRLISSWQYAWNTAIFVDSTQIISRLLMLWRLSTAPKVTTNLRAPL